MPACHPIVNGWCGRIGGMAELQRLAEVVPGVWVAHSRRYLTTSTVLLDGRGGALVIDPAWDPDELAAIPADLAALGVRCVAGLSTHVHYDHVMWHPDLGDVPRWATRGTVEMVDADRDAVVAPLHRDLPDDLVDLAARDLRPIDGELLEWSGPTAVVHVHHAHAPHHLALELPDLGVVVAGDMLSDVEIPMPDGGDTDLATYRTGLESLRDVVGRSRFLVPGHGQVSDRPLERYDADARYLDDVVRTGASDDPRIALDGMPELHAANLERARATRP
jgi:glyoxylase-like metal-dependent hydrolase (beta-lactamase superfamily II)